MDLKAANYVSEVKHRQLAETGGLMDVLEHSRRRNAAESVTGTLLFTGKYFIQAIEGPDVIIDSLMRRLKQDCRHRIIAEFGCEQRCSRRYRGWDLGYAGTSVYVSRVVETALTRLKADPVHEPDLMIELMIRFAER